MFRLTPARASLLLLLLAAVLPGCTHSAPIGGRRDAVIRVRADATKDFSRYRTYAWAPGQLAADRGRPALTEQEAERRVHAALTPRLAAKGLTPAPDAAAADLLISYLATPGRRTAFAPAGPPRDVGGYDEPGLIPPGDEWGAREFEPGTLILQFTDARTRETVWQPTLAADVAEGERQLARAIDDAMKNYPPTR